MTARRKSLPDARGAEQAQALLGEHLDIRTLEHPSTDGLRSLELERFSLWGGDAALQLALAAPEMIETLVLEAPSEPADRQALHELDAPTLVVYGTTDDAVPARAGRIFRELVPNCNYVLVYRAGHALAHDRPEAFASLVADFIERREAFIVNQKVSLLHP